MKEQGELWYLYGVFGKGGTNTGIDISTANPIHGSVAGKAVPAAVFDEMEMIV